MKIAPFFVSSMLSILAFNANAQSALTRDQVQQELKVDSEIRQQLAQHLEVATQAGCELSAVSYSAIAVGNCNSLVQKIAASTGNNASEKFSSYVAALPAR